MQITKYYCDRCGREEVREQGKSNPLWYAAAGGVEKYLCTPCYGLFVGLNDAVQKFLKDDASRPV